MLASRSACLLGESGGFRYVRGKSYTHGQPAERGGDELAIASLIFTGAFFIFTTYVETHALATNNPTLDNLTAPLVTLSENLGVKWMGVVTSLGAMVSAAS